MKAATLVAKMPPILVKLSHSFKNESVLPFSTTHVHKYSGVNSGIGNGILMDELLLPTLYKSSLPQYPLLLLLQLETEYLEVQTTFKVISMQSSVSTSSYLLECTKITYA